MITIPAFGLRRVVLVRCTRAALGDPVGDAPDVDERGYGDPYPGPLTSIASGRTVKVALLRINLDTTTPLFVESSDPSALTIADPANGAVAAQERADLQLTGVDGGTSFRTAEVRIRIGSASGPVIHSLFVLVLKPVTVRMTPHRVTINGAHASGTAPLADVDTIMAKVADIWVHAGVTIKVQPVQDASITLQTPNIVSDNPFPGELKKMLADKWPDGTTNWIPNTINAYFVSQLGTASTLGFGFSRQSFSGFGLPNPGILLGDRTAHSTRSGLIHYANDLAHEVGHFFTLWHAGNKEPPNEREDTWSRRMLMHNFNGMRGIDPWPANDGDGHPFAERPRFNNAGYGDLRRGCMITLRDLPQFTGDGECLTARAAILSAAGPY